MSRYANRLPTDYESAERMLKGKHVRSVLNNTRLSRRGKDEIEVQYHGNVIASFHVDGSMVLTTCGWNTTSTRERLNAILWGKHIAFIQKDHVGYVEVRYVGGHRERTHADTIEIGSDGSIHRIIDSRES